LTAKFPQKKIKKSVDFIAKNFACKFSAVQKKNQSILTRKILTAKFPQYKKKSILSRKVPSSPTALFGDQNA